MLARRLAGTLFLMLFCVTFVWSQTRPRLIQTVDVLNPFPPQMVKISGQEHLAYELHITNFRPADVELLRVEIAPDDQRSISFEGTELARMIGTPVSGDFDKRIVKPGMRVVIYFWFPLESAVVPKTLKHKLVFEFLRESGRERASVKDFAIDVRKQKPVELGPPLRGGPWVALYDPFMERGHRTSIYTINGRARIPARFAIDWIKLDEVGSHTKADASRITNWYGYGAEVLAVADGVVTEAKDDITEHETITTATSPVPLENASGNYITLDLGNGRYAFYEHLQHGSIRVKPGDRVQRGQVIGSLGNSGSSSSGPHLHFHVSDTNATVAAEGLPYVFGNFEVIGSFRTIDAFARDEPWDLPSGRAGGSRKSELPAPNSVVQFP